MPAIEFADRPKNPTIPAWLREALTAERAAAEKIPDVIERRLALLQADELEQRVLDGFSPDSNPSDGTERRFANDAAATATAPSRATGGREGEIVGYAAVFYQPGDPGTEYRLSPVVVERIGPAAFQRALRNGQDVLGLYNHSPDWLLGRTASGTLSLTTDGRGLRYAMPYDSADPQHQSVRAKIRRGDVTGSSFAFRPRKENVQRIGNGFVRTLEEVDLIDVGPVFRPAYTATTATARSSRAERTAEVDQTLARLMQDDWRAVRRRWAIDARLQEIASDTLTAHRPSKERPGRLTR